MKKYLPRRLGVSDDPTAEKPSLHDCIEAVLEVSGSLLDDVLEGLELTIGKVGNKASKMNQRGMTNSIVDDLRVQAEPMRATFGVQLRLAIYRSGSRGSDPETLVRFDDLQLLDERQLQANIEFALAQQELQFATDEVIAPLNALVSSLMGWMSVQAHLNPLRPETFARALRETLFQHVPSEQARANLIGPAAGVLGNSLRDLYRELADWLRSQGIEPVVPLLTSSAQGAGGRSAESPVSRTMLTLDKLRRLLTGELDANPRADLPAADFLHTVPASMVALEDLRMVEPMMKRLTERAHDATAPEGRRKDLARDDSDGKQELGRQLGEEVVRLLLDNLAKDQRLLPPVRAQVKEIEPLLMRLACSDPRFFSDKRHPARRFLDRITHQSLGYKSETDERFQRFINTVSSAVLELMDSQGESESFARALTMLDAQWARVDQEQKARQDEAARALLHAEQRNMLARRVAVDFQRRVQDGKIPESIAAFLLGPWAQVVAEAQLGAGASEDADGYLAIVDDLLWSVQPKLARRNRSRLVQLVPGLLVKMRQGLQLIEFPPERIPVFFDELISLHERAFEPPKPRPAPVPASPQADAPGVAAPGAGSAAAVSEMVDSVEPSSGIDDLPDEFAVDPGQENSDFDVVAATDAVDIWIGGHEANETGYLPEGEVMPGTDKEAARREQTWTEADLALGSWVELQLKGEWVRAQLTWASPHRTLFMFVSGRGLSHSMSRRTMEQLRSRGMLRIVSERHMVDSALDAVARAALLNERKKPKS